MLAGGSCMESKPYTAKSPKGLMEKNIFFISNSLIN